MGDLPQYFKFVRWMLTSSLKENKFEKNSDTSETVDNILTPLQNSRARHCEYYSLVQIYELS